MITLQAVPAPELVRSSSVPGAARRRAPGMAERTTNQDFIKHLNPSSPVPAVSEERCR
jgi:hypothetical protein